MAQGILPFTYQEEKKDTGMTALAGLFFAIFNRISFLRIKLARKGCTGCRECLKDCTTGKPLSKLEKGFDSVECVRCYSCILACPEGTVKLKPRSAR